MIDNKPVFVIYRSTVIPDLEKYIEVFRNEALKNGLELYLCRTETFGCYGSDYLKLGFDAAIEFQPFHKSLNVYRNKVITPRLRKSISNRLKMYILRRTVSVEILNREYCKDMNYLDYCDYVDFFIHKFDYPNNYPLFPGVSPS